MPEFAAPGVGRQSTKVVIDAEFGENANGVLYAVGGSGGGLSVYMEDGRLIYEYNMMIIENYKATTEKIPAGKHQIVIDTSDRQAGGAGRRRHIRRWKGSRKDDGRTDRAGRVLGNRVLRHRRRSRLDRVAGL